ncbi:MAG TPA: isoprenylcysteine carboxylmethyltransferase family protein [Spirochaetota bacterium]|nr:isoprenylcysteine carboxylmethyltransferase family protein [Spirochaetota bacterium]HQF09220.1 isoprenylcysteine carboxylmethyltransferase family protein [Spirochaetota bacterium]HQH97761.1 isoprenylcysteine carboxylmethyltransferase family protein [Spirochaetota bacterium]
MKKIVSLLLPLSLLAGIGVLAWFKISYHHELWDSFYFNFDIVIIGLYAIWIVYEVKVSSVDAGQDTVVRDFGTRELYGLSQALTVFSALWFEPVWTGPGPWHVIGLVIFIAGVCFRIWAIETLGKYYSHSVRKIDGHRIVDSGPYGFLRHPAYTGMITAHVGIAVFYFNYVAAAVLVLLLVPSIVIRILVEEKTLMTVDGYIEFAKTRKRIIPCVW